MYPRLKSSVAAILCAIAANTHAQNLLLAEAPMVLVTASRFAETDVQAPANVSVITQDEIAHSPARSIPELLKTQAGIDVRPLYGSMGIDAAVDIRGTGEAAGSNTLILLDGQRINPVDMGSIKWETIPLSAIQQIEIIRGSGSVLYGDRAANGVINIITDKSAKPRASASIEAGSYGYGALDASVAGGTGNWFGSLFVNSARTDGWRKNSDAERSSVSGRGAYRFGENEAFVDYAAYSQDYGLPSSLTKAQYRADPEQASTPHYRITRDGWRLRPGTALQLTSSLQFEIDGVIAQDSLLSRNSDWLYRNRQASETHSLSPRLKWSHGLPGAISSDTVFGFDYFDGKVHSDSLDFATHHRTNRQTASLTNHGFYGQNMTTWRGGFDSTVGIRQQYFSEKVADQGAALNDRLSDSLTAWELGGGYRFNENLRAYAKVARNFRLPNTDELFAYDPTTFAKLFNGTLKPQTGHLREGGIIWSRGSLRQQFSVYQQDNENEIGYIAANGRNANLDPLRRRGVESESTWKPSPDWQVRLMLTYIDARFTDGPYDGKWVPLVPNHKETLSVQWSGGSVGTHTALLNVVGDRYFGSDFSNGREKLGGYTTLDYQASWNFRPLTIGVRITNLTDTKYSAIGYSGKYYPADPRSAFVSARVDF